MTCKTQTVRLKSLLAIFICMIFHAANVYAQNPQWIMAQPPTVPDPTNSNFTHVAFNYYLSAQEREEPYYINRISDEYIKTDGKRLNFDRIYGSYYNRQAYDLYLPSNFRYSDQEIPAFLIGRETTANPKSSEIKVWSANTYPNGWDTYSFTRNSSQRNLFDGLNGTDLIFPGDEPEFTVIPRERTTNEFFLFTYIRTAASNGANGMLVYFIIDTSTKKINGPYYPKDQNGDIRFSMAAGWGPKGAIAIEKIPAGGERQKLYVAVENIGIYKFTLDHLYAHDNNLHNASTAGGQFYYPTRICAPLAIQGGVVVNGSNFATSELEISPDGNLLAWADDNTYSGGTPTATVYTIDLTNRVHNSIPISSVISAQKVNGIEFNPNYNPAAGVNTRLYVTAGSGSSNNDGLFKISGTGAVTPIGGRFSGSSRNCAQSQLEIDYNKTLAMVYADVANPNFQFVSYLPESSTQTGSWGDLQKYKAQALTTSPFNYPVHRLPRQVDYWDYKFGGTIHGKTAPLVANGGCSGGTVQRTITYSAPVITSINSWDIEYNWELKDASTGAIVLTGTAPTVTYTFPTTPFKSYELILKVITKEWGGARFYNFFYQTKMIITTTNGCPPPSGSRLAQTSSDDKETVIYPNPVIAGELKIKLPANYNEAQVEITDLQGRLVRNATISNMSTLDIQDLSAGMYMVNVTTPDFSKKEKIMVTK
ncbi:T9SS type A sorting domain-containing protein [Adhaeribacter sp. BT258]|uniref:T9SS type A sorting domain-containing protein n=1 Tax=Adhaeribacter terrigena TaxID=2793070 RepID=A0ABS1C579_9BACT|nr:T9SS type A sorting domain-containing protein [Adhaeribacter terrigena]MBK0404529.1 T9SS type A sorting domain-containing protein [Adhaeribacter terrigena]